MAADIKAKQNSDAYKPSVIPKSLKVVQSYGEEKTFNEPKERNEHEDTIDKGRDGMSKQAVTANILGASIVLLVSDIKAASDFYKGLGFKYEEIGGPEVAHVHVSRDNMTFILHPAKVKRDVRPASSVEGGLYFDVFAYTDAVDLLLEECRAQGVEIVNGPNYSEHWNEFTMRDADGYRIAFGGGVSKK
ncbi:VOC family protein [Paenibacillus solisilvae]|uniref:VOC family protein n=1 Tax=Paenibacillus solisilvae TaxID=2486751 RepID=A0ABW0W357_9BACL